MRNSRIVATIFLYHFCVIAWLNGIGVDNPYLFTVWLKEKFQIQAENYQSNAMIAYRVRNPTNSGLCICNYTYVHFWFWTLNRLSYSFREFLSVQIFLSSLLFLYVSFLIKQWKWYIQSMILKIHTFKTIKPLKIRTRLYKLPWQVTNSLHINTILLGLK